LLDLFVDTSLQWTDTDEKAHRGVVVQRAFRGVIWQDTDGEQLAAKFFLHRDPLTGFLRAVLEGAPGQGKSTITQYICQVHRMRLLNRDLRRIPNEHLDCIVRFPLRVDLRDFASWIGGKNPYAADPKASRPSESQNSLESFLAFQITQTSGGHSFSVSDLATFAKASHLLIVLDGFDEVADIPTREQIVKEISRAAIRLDAASRSLQIIVTSRPAAFAKSPGFSRKDWSHLSLQSMDLDQINEYANKWMTARYLSPQEKAEFRTVLSQKLDQPHMRDLARNPMQLAILLSLIQTRGLSLPDKRTALYDSYMELFFSREAEKSSVVREHRDLLVDLHQFLAWVIQTEAEEAKSKGSITEEQLRTVLRDYLTREGHDPSLVDALFVGMVERVVALVSRVQGTFEFEVQPLREYFAARHLYETAPYSPPGRERTGTKPERFDALARNFYWLNVTRFYCGCYSRGELGSLADGLIDLARDEDYKFTSYPRLLILMLLGDWVFTQQPVVVGRLTTGIVQAPGFKILLASLVRERSSASLIVPERCGRTELLRDCAQELINDSTPNDVTQTLAISIRAALDPSDTRKFWLEIRGSLSEDRWLYIGRLLGQLAACDQGELRKLYDKYGSRLINELGFINGFDFIESCTETLKDAIEITLQGSGDRFLDFGPGTGPSSYIAYFAFSLDADSYQSIFTGTSPYFRRAIAHGLPLRESFDFGPHNAPRAPATSQELQGRIDPGLLGRCDRLLATFARVGESKAATWSTSLKPWSELVNAGMSEFGMRPIFVDLALIAAGVNSKTENGSIGKGLSDSEISLCERIRYARLKSGSVNWWTEQFAAAKDEEQRNLVLTCFLVWATPRAILVFAEEISTQLDQLTAAQWSRLVGRISRSTKSDRLIFDQQLSSKLAKCSTRFCIALSLRSTSETAERIILSATRSYKGDDRRILRLCLDARLSEAHKNPSKWKELLAIVRRAYKVSGFAAPNYWGSADDLTQMPVAIAKSICKEAASYPLALVEAAQNQLTKAAGSKAKAPGAIARTEDWFAP
jgi:hypothetical protein